MEKLINAFENLLSDFCDEVAEKHNLDKDELMSIWKEEKESKTKKTSSPLGTSPNTPSGSCPYVFQKGKDKDGNDKKGTVCGAKSLKDKTYCTLHKKSEGKTPKEKKVLPEPKSSTSGKSTSGKTTSTPTPVITAPVFRAHKTLGKLFHSPTNFYMKSKEDHSIEGKIVGDKLYDLNDKDIETCKKMNFKLAEKYLKSKKAEEDEDEVEEEVEPVKKDKKSKKVEEEVEPVKKDKKSKKVEEEVEPVKKDKKSRKVEEEVEPVKKDKKSKKVEEDDSETVPVKKDKKSKKVEEEVEPVKKDKKSRKVEEEVVDEEEVLEDEETTGNQSKIVNKALGIDEEELEEDETEIQDD
jgi:hypothetical protein